MSHGFENLTDCPPWLLSTNYCPPTAACQPILTAFLWPLVRLLDVPWLWHLHWLSTQASVYQLLFPNCCMSDSWMFHGVDHPLLTVPLAAFYRLLSPICCLPIAVPCLLSPACICSSPIEGSLRPPTLPTVCLSFDPVIVPSVVSFTSVTVPLCLSPVCLSVHWLFLLGLFSSTLKYGFFLDESVKPDRPETPAEAKLIGKEFGDFLNLKVREFWGSW